MTTHSPLGILPSWLRSGLHIISCLRRQACVSITIGGCTCCWELPPSVQGSVASTSRCTGLVVSSVILACQLLNLLQQCHPKLASLHEPEPLIKVQSEQCSSRRMPCHAMTKSHVCHFGTTVSSGKVAIVLCWCCIYG